jgi:regulator of replication initiation timing
VRKHLLFLVLVLISVAPRSPAQVPDPGAMQDHEAEREKLLKASDQLDNMQANTEATKAAVDGMKTSVSALQANVTQLQADNAALKQQLADLQAAFDSYKADQLKARQTLIDNVADMIAAQKSSKPAKKKAADDSVSSSTSSPATTSAPKADAALAPPPDASQPAPKTTTPTTAEGDPIPAPPPKPQKGYYHVVADGETLTMIVAAYRDNGVRVTASQIRKANGLTEDSELKPGQKLFIPKPGT